MKQYLSGRRISGVVSAIVWVHALSSLLQNEPSPVTLYGGFALQVGITALCIGANRLNLIAVWLVAGMAVLLSVGYALEIGIGGGSIGAKPIVAIALWWSYTVVVFGRLIVRGLSRQRSGGLR